MFYKELRLLYIEIKKWEALAEKLNVSDVKRQQIAHLKPVLIEAILIEKKKLSELELNIANASVKTHNVVEGTLASTDQNIDSLAILALTETDNNNNQQEVELVIRDYSKRLLR